MKEGKKSEQESRKEKKAEAVKMDRVLSEGVGGVGIGKTREEDQEEHT